MTWRAVCGAALGSGGGGGGVGVGLGLALCREMVGAHGAHIRVRSVVRPGQMSPATSLSSIPNTRCEPWFLELNGNGIL